MHQKHVVQILIKALQAIQTIKINSLQSQSLPMGFTIRVGLINDLQSAFKGEQIVNIIISNWTLIGTYEQIGYQSKVAFLCPSLESSQTMGPM